MACARAHARACVRARVTLARDLGRMPRDVCRVPWDAGHVHVRVRVRVMPDACMCTCASACMRACACARACARVLSARG